MPVSFDSDVLSYALDIKYLELRRILTMSFPALLTHFNCCFGYFKNKELGLYQIPVLKEKLKPIFCYFIIGSIYIRYIWAHSNMLYFTFIKVYTKENYRM